MYLTGTLATPPAMVSFSSLDWFLCRPGLLCMDTKYERAQSPACVPAYITKDMSAAALYDVGCLPPYMPRRNVTLSAKISRQAVLTQAGCFHNDQRRLDVGNRPQPEEEDTESSCATHIP